MTLNEIDELAYEGHRWYDLVRTSRAKDVMSAFSGNWQDKFELWPIPQREILNNPEIDVVVEIAVADIEIVERMSGRRTHPGSGRTYHVKFNPPKVAGKDDVTGEDLIQRDDDKEETVKHRLAVYHEQTKPLINYYGDWAASRGPGAPRYVRIAGVGKVEEIRDRIFAALAA